MEVLGFLVPLNRFHLFHPGKKHFVAADPDKLRAIRRRALSVQSGLSRPRLSESDRLHLRLESGQLARQLEELIAGNMSEPPRYSDE